jgi:GT2 family glycosyltransferase
MNVDIIIISHNHGKYLNHCLSSIQKSVSNLRFKVILIINNKLDKTSIKVAQKFSFVNLQINSKPKGFAANINKGVKQTNSPYIFIINPDTVLTKNSLEKMVKFIEKNKKVAICGPKLVFLDGTLQYSARRFPSFKIALIRRTPLRYFFKNSSINKFHLGYDLDHNKAQKVDWLLGAVMLIRRKAFDDIGYFDERFFLYCEDIDYCYRAWEKGWEVWYYPEAVVKHHHLAESDRRFLSIYTLYHYHSMVIYFLKNIAKLIR